jgi:hypothetical protein
MARRVERGSVRSVLRSGKRLIPRSELRRVGLLPPKGSRPIDRLGDSVLSETVALSDDAEGAYPLLEVLVRELLERVQRQAAELAHYRVLTAQAENLRLERELADLRFRLSALEAGGTQLALQPAPPEHPQSASAPRDEEARPPFRASSSNDRLWLPPRAASEQARSGHDMGADPFLPAGPGPPDSRASRPRILFLTLEMLFIGVVALLAWVADLGPVLAAATVGVAWLLAATLELARWRH